MKAKSGALLVLVGYVLVSGSGPVAASDAAFTGPCVLGVGPPTQLYDAVAGAEVSRFAGSTRDLIAGDLDGDGFPDLVNLTPNGAQVFRNDGTTGGVLHFTLIQEFAADQGYRGGLLDLDGDHDLDLVLGDSAYVVVAHNDGTGHFSPELAFTHRAGVSTLAVPFDTFTDPLHAGNKHRVLLAHTSDHLEAGALGVPDTQPWARVLEFTPGGLLTLVQLLDPIVADDVAVRDLDGDGDNDLVISNRSGHGDDPLDAYESLAADSPGGLYAHAPAFDFTGAPFNFGFGVDVADDGSIVVGSWHRTYLLQRNHAFAPPSGRPLLDPAHAWLTATSVPADPNGATYPPAEVFAAGLGDLNCTGPLDLAFQGWFTPLELDSLEGPADVPGNRFVAAPASGVAHDLRVLDWDQDVNGVDDVIVGTTTGLFFYRSSNGGTAGTPAEPPEPPAPVFDCFVHIFDVMRTLEGLIEPTRDPALYDPTARLEVAEALAQVHAIDPRFLTAGTFDLPDPPMQQIQQIFAKLQFARNHLLAALAALGPDPSFTPILEEEANELVDASTCLTEQLMSLEDGDAAAAKRLPANRRAARLWGRARADADRAALLAASAESATNLRTFGRLGRRAIATNARAFRRGAQAFTIQHR